MSEAVSEDVRLDNRRPSRPYSNMNVCKFFRRTGTCMYGDRCMFSHNIPEMKSDYFQATNSQDIKYDSSPKRQANVFFEKASRGNFQSRPYVNFGKRSQYQEKKNYPNRFGNQSRSSRDYNSMTYGGSKRYQGTRGTETQYDSSSFGFRSSQTENRNRRFQNNFFNTNSRSNYRRSDSHRTFQSRFHNTSSRNNGSFHNDVYIEEQMSEVKTSNPDKEKQENTPAVPREKVWATDSTTSEVENGEEDSSSSSSSSSKTEFDPSSKIVLLQGALENLEIKDRSRESSEESFEFPSVSSGIIEMQEIAAMKRSINPGYQLENRFSQRTDNLIPYQNSNKEFPENESNATNRMLTARRDLLVNDLTEEDFCKLRKTEIDQLRKRFPQRINYKSEDKEDIFRIEITSTDPDWSLDYKTVVIRLTFPDNYPKSYFQVWVEDSDNIHLPKGITQYITPILMSWVRSEHENCITTGTVKLLFRPFIHWLDKNLETVFHYSVKQITKVVNTNDVKVSDKVSGSVMKSDYVQDKDKPHCSFQYQPPHRESSSLQRTTQSTFLSNVRKGTEIKFRSVHLGENAATLLCQKLNPVIQCQRCKTQCNIATVSNRPNYFHCNKCNYSLLATFHPSLLHPHASILGYLELKNCSICDLVLVDCDFSLSCLNCNKQMMINGLSLDQNFHTWCHSCHSKMSISLSSPKFEYYGPVERSINASQIEKKIKKTKETCIQEGKCLPDNGTCKHYKKSYRWLRFPCCGKAFPCDKCHNEKESHEMKVANRMICGFCGKEQPFAANKSCIGCKSGVTKSSSAHWEGGKGCRDKNKMSRDDAHKFKGAAKTISRKCQPSSQQKNSKSKK